MQEVNSKKKTMLIYEIDQTQKHKTQRKHVENPERIVSIIDNFKDKNLIEKCFKVINKIDEKIQKEQILQVHTQDYLDFIEGMWPEETEKPQIMVKDCYINSYTYESARISAQAVWQACQAVAEKQVDNAFAVVRPPGHHSGASAICHGFCFLNNVGISVKQLQQKYNYKKILIFDWDIHHGDGTSKMFIDDPNVLFISIHRYDKGIYFPQTGNPSYVGEKEGKGFNINIGWNLQDKLNPGDQEYIYVFERICLPIIQQFQPEFILVSSGFDAALNDPIGKCSLTDLGYCYMLQKLLQVQSNLVAALEGGYNLDSLKFSSEAVLRVLQGQKIPINEFISNKIGQNIDYYKQNCLPNSIAFESAKETIKYINQYWQNCLNSKEILDFEQEIIKNSFKSCNVTAGHKGQVEFIGDKFFKQSKKNEIQFYLELDDVNNKFYQENQILKQFIPKFYGTKEQGKNILLELENLLIQKEKGSIIDLKLGQVTAHKSAPKEKFDRDIIKQKQTTSGELGFRVCGANIKDQSGNVIEKFDANCSPKEKINEIFEKLLKSNGSEKVNKQALQKILEFLNQLLDFFVKKNSRSFISTSIFIVVDNISNQTNIKLIDFNYVDEILEENGKDENLLFGLKNLIVYFQKIQGNL